MSRYKTIKRLEVNLTKVGDLSHFIRMYVVTSVTYSGYDSFLQIKSFRITLGGVYSHTSVLYGDKGLPLASVPISLLEAIKQEIKCYEQYQKINEFNKELEAELEVIYDRQRFNTDGQSSD